MSLLKYNPGIAFHPKPTLLTASLHSGSIQMWSFQMGTSVKRFDKHNGQVCGIAFHPSQPLFVSVGVDYKLQYRSGIKNDDVSFHREHPWIPPASHDQTIQIWNWQSRQCIPILTGHK
ncbi:uncharacterized protein MELLADRAFT_85331 [Melampsora larici-populina 98AG31]|uniref:Uncharacterized protein n=1 Tax=Melampsora larici-populina (strain 98AG31 / pathotype 3-4-7) TaxID=747676 RepID=F4SCZ9_MELLP|nr:uncharacterized protein MELLADRAFT_85331 [Melampsora larici-populina 98AG31]EGF97466.1 hypothetical protein MELLADRAFT_85331 [Melampsora larici-populina 98AG31]